MSEWNYPFFTKSEMSCHCGCGGVPTPEFMNWLVEVRREFGYPMIITSAYRCAKYNGTEAKTGSHSPHVYGVAVDVSVHGNGAYRLIAIALKHGVQGLGFDQRLSIALSHRYVHLDMAKNEDGFPRPTVWSYP